MYIVIVYLILYIVYLILCIYIYLLYIVYVYIYRGYIELLGFWCLRGGISLELDVPESS